MASKPIDRPEFLFQSVNLIQEVITHSAPDDPHWVPMAPGVAFRPLMFDVTQGGWSTLLRVAPGCRLARHYHTAPVHGFTVRGCWRYPEHDWVAREGSYIFEPPGEAHTLVVDAGEEKMLSFFVTRGSLIYTDAEGHQVGYEDVFTRLEQAREHFEAAGLDQSILDAMVRYDHLPVNLPGETGRNSPVGEHTDEEEVQCIKRRTVVFRTAAVLAV
jgi:hypothetical protein